MVLWEKKAPKEGNDCDYSGSTAREPVTEGFVDLTITPVTPETCSEGATSESGKRVNKDVTETAVSKTSVNIEDQCKDFENPKGINANQNFLSIPSLKDPPPPRNRTPRCRRQTLSLVTCNIEGVKSNKLYLQKLCQDNDIVCLQEHWLWDFDKQWLKNEITDFEPFVRCHDSNDNISNFNVPRGRAGVAILWNKKLSDTVSRLDVGNENVMAVEINSTKKLCIINA